MCMYVHILLPFQCAYPQKAQGGPASPFSVGEVGVCRATRHGLLCRATRHGLLLWCPLLHMFRYLCRFDLGRLLHQRSLGRLRIWVPVLTQCNAADNHLVFNETVQSLHRIDLACLLYESPPLASCSLCPLPSRRCTISKGCSKSMQHVVTQTIPSTLEC